MLILHIIASFNPVTGGPAEVIRNIILEYNKLGAEAEVVCLDQPDTSYLQQEPQAFKVHALGHMDSVWFFSPNLITWLGANGKRFDAIILHGLWLYPSYAITSLIQRIRAKSAGTKASATSKVPSLTVFPHGMLDPYFQRTTRRRLKAVRNWLYWKFFEHRVIREADALLFTCETELLLARQTFRPYQPKREINLGNGIVNPPVFKRHMIDAFLEKCPEVTDRTYLLFLSRIHYKKGVDLLIHAYAAIVEAQFDSRDKLPLLVIAGPGLDTPYGETIKQVIQKYPLIENMVSFPGMLTGDAKWGALYECEAFCLPSHQENFGIAVAEALACSKPVLISNQVNIWREVKQGGSGIIGNDTLESTQHMMEQWLRMSKEERQQMALNARKTFEMYFQMEQVIHRLNHVLESLK